MDMLFLLFCLLFFVSLLLICVTEVRFRRQLREQEREISAFIGVISHQLHTQFTSIKWYTEMLAQKEFGRLKVAQLEAIDKITAGYQNAEKILDRLMEISRLDRCEMIIAPTTIAVREHTQNMIGVHESQAKERDISIKFDKGSDYLLAYIDPIILHSVLDILMNNAIIYTKNGGTITVGIEERKKEIVVSISDTGVGIPSAEKRHIFSKFFRGKQAFLMHPNGNGLGLYLAQKLVKKMPDCSLSFTSKENEGTTFSLSMQKASVK